MCVRSIGFMLLLVLLFAVSSCTFSGFDRFTHSSEFRLTSVQLPEDLQKDRGYDVVVFFESQERPTIKEVCFRWVTESMSVSSPSLYYFSMETQGTHSSGSAGGRRLDDGEYRQTGFLNCVTAASVEYGSPGRIIAHLDSPAAGANKLECTVRYVTDGLAKDSNRIAAKVRME